MTAALRNNVTQGCQIFLDTKYQNGGNYTILPLQYQMAINYTKWPQYTANDHRIKQQFPFQGPPIFAQTRIFGLKIYIPATLTTVHNCQQK
jgi:hypothetical protein